MRDIIDLTRSAIVENFAEYIHEEHKEVKRALEKSTIKFKEDVDKHKRV